MAGSIYQNLALQKVAHAVPALGAADITNLVAGTSSRTYKALSESERALVTPQITEAMSNVWLFFLVAGILSFVLTPQLWVSCEDTGTTQPLTCGCPENPTKRDKCCYGRGIEGSVNQGMNGMSGSEAVPEGQIFAITPYHNLKSSLLSNERRASREVGPHHHQTTTGCRDLLYVSSRAVVMTSCYLIGRQKAATSHVIVAAL